jgi:Lamin Tail Domain/Putative metal-binding motif
MRAPLVALTLLTACSDSTFQVTDKDPTVSFLQPTTGTTFVPETALQFCAQVSDEQELDTLQVTLSSDVGGELWTLDDDLQPCGGGNIGGVVLLSDANQTLTLAAVDSRDQAGQASIYLTPTPNTTPVCILTAPVADQAYELGDRVDVVGALGDAETSPPDLSVTIESDRDGVLYTGAPSSAGTFSWGTSELTGGDHGLTLSVTDERGSVAQCAVEIYVDPCLDQDGDGWTECDDDCDDHDSATYPDAPEQADSRDNDCDGTVDEGTVLYDDDGDGFTDIEGDCDDANVDIYPGAPETGYDGIDDDCNGVDGTDIDADGYTAVEVGGPDCDDNNADVHPGATEVWYDGVDQDCDGASDYDQDEDGFDSDVYGGDDCDDTNARVSPAETETWYDGTDQDCDGTSDYDQDGDGSDSDAYGGDDCTDTDSTIGPGVTETRNGSDDDCDGSCDEGLITAGELIITEIMKDPDGVTDAYGEWFEVYNTSAVAIRMCGWTIEDEGTDTFMMTSEVVIPSGGYAVFGRTNDTTLNGGVVVSYEFSTGMQLGNGGDEIILKHGSDEIDRVEWTDGGDWPDPAGASISLDPGSLSRTANDDGTNWCTATKAWAAGDKGSPGDVNEGC